MKFHDHKTASYQGRVWAHKAMCDALEAEVEARISVMCPSGEEYKPAVTHVTSQHAGRPPGWYASFGAWGFHDHAYRTRLGALLGMLSLIADGIIFPGCSAGHDGVILHENVSGAGIAEPLR